MSGKCPGCGKSLTSVEIKPIDISQGFQAKWNGVSYQCPNLHCQTILSVGMDPIALKTDTVNEVVKTLRGRGGF